MNDEKRKAWLHAKIDAVEQKAGALSEGAVFPFDWEGEALVMLNRADIRAILLRYLNDEMNAKQVEQ